MSGPSLRLLILVYTAVLILSACLHLWHERATIMTALGMPTPVPEAVRVAATATARGAAAQATVAQAEEARREETRQAAETARQATLTAEGVRRTEETRRAAEARQRDQEARQRQQEEAAAAARRRQTFFREDFSRVPVGEVPHGWIGTENVICKEIGPRGQKVLTTFQPGPVKLRIPETRFPDNFRVRWVISGEDDWQHTPDAYVEIAGLKAGITRYGNNVYSAFIDQTQVGLGRQMRLTASPIELVLEKRERVFRLLLDGRELVVSRLPDFVAADGFSLILDGNSDQPRVSLHLLEGIDLGS